MRSRKQSRLASAPRRLQAHAAVRDHAASGRTRWREQPGKRCHCLFISDLDDPTETPCAGDGEGWAFAGPLRWDGVRPESRLAPLPGGVGAANPIAAANVRTVRQSVTPDRLLVEVHLTWTRSCDTERRGASTLFH
jgi:hypothetical protein